MKRFLMSVLAVSLFAGIVVAADNEKTQIKTDTVLFTSTNAASTAPLYGYLDSVYIDVPAPMTGALVIATADETVLTLASALMADGWYRIRFPICDASGATVIGLGTNGSARLLMVGDKLTFTLEKSMPTNSETTVTFRTKIDDK